MQYVDLGMAEYAGKQFFVNNCGAGFDAFVGLEANRSEMKSVSIKSGLGNLPMYIMSFWVWQGSNLFPYQSIATGISIRLIGCGLLL